MAILMIFVILVVAGIFFAFARLGAKDRQEKAEQRVAGTRDGVRADGQNGQVVVSGSWLTIERRGFRAALNQGFKGSKRLPLSSLTSVQMKSPGLQDGYIQFGVLGGNESRRGLLAAWNDENSVTFDRAQEAAFVRVHDYVIQQIEARDSHSASSPVIGSSQSISAQLAELAELKKSGSLTEDEYAEAKRAVLRNGQ